MHVWPDRTPSSMRFDFSHPRGVDEAELERIEGIVNAQVIENPRVQTTVEELKQAKARGVVALDGGEEKARRAFDSFTTRCSATTCK